MVMNPTVRSKQHLKQIQVSLEKNLVHSIILVGSYGHWAAIGGTIGESV